ncbi:MAG: cell division protein ZapA [Muribaculaceae bacterium]|nr:cell division protein ZapA [Muribaculaceae bacterium]
MNSKETKIQIDVKIGEERISMAIPFSQQDFVRSVESELNIFLKETREKLPNRWPSTYLAMAAYEFAKQYFLLKDRYEKESEDAEDLLEEIKKLLGEEDTQEDVLPFDEFDVY